MIVKSKPDPEVFLTAARKLGADPGECLVIEDAVAGIEAARAGGFFCAAIGEAASCGKADYVLESLWDAILLMKQEGRYENEEL